MYEDAPQELVHDLIAEAVFGDHPLGRPVIGTAEVISSISPRRSPATTPRCTCPGTSSSRPPGTSTTTELLELVQSALDRRGGGIGAGPTVRPPLVETPPPALRFQRKDTEQYHVCLGAPGISRSDRRRFAASLLDAILGGSASSRLFQEIREKRGHRVRRLLLRLAVHGHGSGRDLRRDARGQPRRGARDRRRADRRHRRRQPPGAGARAREGEPQGAHPALDGVDVDAHEPARQVADHRLGAALARPDRRRDRRRRRGVGVRARRRAARAGAAVGGLHRPERGAASSSALERVTPSLARAA